MDSATSAPASNPEQGVVPEVLSPTRDPEPMLGDGDAADAALAAAGDTRAFERLYRAHAARIHGLARRMVSQDEAAEVTQDVFVRAWHKLGTFRGEAAFGTWLHRLAVNVMLGRRGQLGLERGRFEDAEALEVVPSRPAGTDFKMDFESAMDLLPPGARQIFVLHDVEGYKHAEIAQTLGIATGTSKAQLHRARMALRQHLTR
jgi:RNA polymerase sigma-70 factor (ECF subfamily)